MAAGLWNTVKREDAGLLSGRDGITLSPVNQRNMSQSGAAVSSGMPKKDDSLRFDHEKNLKIIGLLCPDE